MSEYPEIDAVLAGESEGCIVCGDCLEALQAIPDNSVHSVVTDPPYGGGLAVDFADRFASKAGKWWKNTDRSTQKRHAPIIGDDAPFDPGAVLAVKCKSKTLWGANWYADRLPDSGGWLVWDKRNGHRDVTEADWPMGEGELAWTDIGKGVRIFRHTWFGLIRDSERGEHWHPTQKPVELMMWCIRRTKAPLEAIILDPYAGAGATCVAAKKCGLRYIGIELDARYCEIARNRIRDTEKPLFT